MFKVGDSVELDLESDINLDYDGTPNPEEMEWLASKGLLPYSIYTILKIDTDEYTGDCYVKLFDGGHYFCAERFKLAAPLNLENE